MINSIFARNPTAEYFMDCMAFPAYVLEHEAFGTVDYYTEKPVPQVKDCWKQILTRIAALVAPFFYAYQALLGISLTIISSPLLLCGGGIVPGFAGLHAAISLQNLVSSLLEIPEKLIYGPDCQPNYCGHKDRYRPSVGRGETPQPDPVVGDDDDLGDVDMNIPPEAQG